MDLALLERVLHGDQEAIALFGEAEHCAVIDWRDGPVEIVAAVAAFLPNGYLTIQRCNEIEYELVVHGKSPKVMLVSPQTRQEAHILAINEALSPEFEIRQFRPCEGDGYSLFVAPSSVWANIQSEHHQAAERLFLTAQRLFTYWSKSYIARLFTRP